MGRHGLLPANTILGLTTGVTDGNGEFTSGAGAGGMPLTMQPIGQRLMVTVTAIGLIVNPDGTIALTAGAVRAPDPLIRRRRRVVEF